jgi:Gluconate 2-dehydrogenase subunit 3
MTSYGSPTGRCLSPGHWDIPTHTLDLTEAVLIAAIAEQVIPLEEEPGASQSRVVQFIDQQLEGALARLEPAYHQGLKAFDCACHADTGSGFLALSTDQRRAYLSRIERGHKLAAFYGIVCEHARQSLNWRPLQFQQPFVQRNHAV